MTRQGGYTLMELMVAISIIVVVVISGVGLFYRSMYSSSRASLNASLDGQGRLAVGTIQRLVLYSKIRSLDGLGRDDCLASPSSFLSGDILTVSDEYGLTEIKLIDDGLTDRIASNSSYISSSQLKIDKLMFTWDCSGVYDKVDLYLRAGIWSDSGVLWNHWEDFEQSIILRNSGSLIN